MRGSKALSSLADSSGKPGEEGLHRAHCHLPSHLPKELSGLSVKVNVFHWHHQYFAEIFKSCTLLQFHNRFGSATIRSQITPAKKDYICIPGAEQPKHFVYPGSQKSRCGLCKEQIFCTFHHCQSATHSKDMKPLIYHCSSEVYFPSQFFMFHRALKKKSHSLSSRPPQKLKISSETQHQALDIPGYWFVECIISQMHYFSISFFTFYIISHGISLRFKSAFSPFFYILGHWDKVN